MDGLVKFLAWGVIGFVAVIAIGVLSGLPVWILWNQLVPRLFSGPTLTLLDAIGLSILCSCLFKSGGGTSSK